MGFDQLTCKRNAEALPTFERPIGSSAQPIHCSRQFVLRHPRAIVRDHDPAHTLLSREVYQDLAPCTCRSNRIVQEVADCLAELTRVGLDPGARSATQIQRQAAFFENLGPLPHYIRQEGQEAKRFLGDGHQPRFALRQVEHIFHLLGQATDRPDDRIDIVAALLGQVAGYACLQQFGKAADGGQRRAEFIGHVGEEARLHLIRLFQRLVPFAQGILRHLRIGDVENGEKAVAVRQRHTGIFQNPSILQGNAPARALAVQRRGANGAAYGLGVISILEMRGDSVQNSFRRRMAVEEIGRQTPTSRETAVPDLHPSIWREYRQRFEQTVEGCSARAQQGVARGGQGQLLRPVLGDEHEAAVRHRLCDYTQMRAAGKRPCFFLRFPGREPFGMFGAPGREIANFRSAALFARISKNAVEGLAPGDRACRDREDTAKRLIGRYDAALAVELGNPDGKLIQHLPLSFAESPEGAPLLLQFFHVDGISRDAFRPERKITHPHGAARTIDGRGDHTFHQCGLFRRLRSKLRGSASLGAFDELDLFGDHLVHRIGSNCSDVGGVHQFQPAIGRTEPHRHGSSLDQAGQSDEILPRLKRFRAEPRKFALAFAEIEDPDQRRAAGPHLRICERSAQGEAAVRRRRRQCHSKRRSGFLGRPDVSGKLFQLRDRQAAAALARRRAAVEIG